MSNPYSLPQLDAIWRSLEIRRTIFVSYHHDSDQRYYDALSSAVADEIRLVRDNSLERQMDSDDVSYVMRRIREKCIVGSSITIVLCGLHTPWRKYVDWEIDATLKKQHGLLGILLPTLTTWGGKRQIPDRLYDNYLTGFAHIVEWSEFVSSAAAVKAAIEVARAKPKSRIYNERKLRCKSEYHPSYYTLLRAFAAR